MWYLELKNDLKSLKIKQTTKHSDIIIKIIKMINNKIIVLTLSLLTITLVSKAQVEIVSGGTSSAYTVAVPGKFVLTNGLQVSFKAHTANAASATLSVSGTPAQPITKLGGSVSIVGSDILANQIVTVAYDGSSWQMISAVGSTPTAPTTYWSPNGADIYNNNAGNVGIGTSGAPNAKLEVRHAGTLGNILLFPTATSDPLTINALGGGAKYIKLLDVNGITMKFGTNGFVGLLGTSSNHSLSLMANGSIAMTILQNGNIGIGTSTPTSTLKVNGSIAGNFIAPNVSNYTCVPKDYFVYITIGGSVSLPLANSVDAGSVIIIRNQTGSNELVSVQGTDSVFPMNSCVGGCASMAIVSTPSTSTSARFISDGVNKWIEW